MDKQDYSESRRAKLAHRTKLAIERNATTFLWSFQRLIGCFNHETFGPLTVDTLLAFIQRCTWPHLPDNYQGYQFAMAPVTLKPYNVYGSHSKSIRCQPMLQECRPDPLRGDEKVVKGDYIVFFKDLSGNNIYQPRLGELPDFAELFKALKSLEYDAVPSFDMNEEGNEIEDTLKCEAGRTLPYNGSFERCVVTGQQSTGGPEQPGFVEAHWIYPPSLFGSHPGPRNNSEELSSETCWSPSNGLATFHVPNNLIAMREDVYDLFKNHAFGIDIDALPHARIYVFNAFKVAQVESMSQLLHPAVEVKDPMAQAFFREHFQQCLFSGIIGGDVKDDLECTDNIIQFMLQHRYGKPGENPHPVQTSSQWKTDMGEALKEWCLYNEGSEAEED